MGVSGELFCVIFLLFIFKTSFIFGKSKITFVNFNFYIAISANNSLSIRIIAYVLDELELKKLIEKDYFTSFINAM